MRHRLDERHKRHLARLGIALDSEHLEVEDAEYQQHYADWKITLPRAAHDILHMKVLGHAAWKQHAQALAEKERVKAQTITHKHEHRHKFPLWVIGALVLLLGLLIVPRAHCQFSKINSIDLRNNDNSAQGFVSYPFTFKAGANCSWSPSGSTFTFNCSGSPACTVQASPGAGTLSAAITGLTSGGSVCANGTYTETAKFTWSDTNGNVIVWCTGLCTWKMNTAATQLLSVTGSLRKAMWGDWTLDGNNNNAALWSCDSCSNFAMGSLDPGGFVWKPGTGTNSGNGMFQITSSTATVQHVYGVNISVPDVRDVGLLFSDSAGASQLTDVRLTGFFIQENSTTDTDAAVKFHSNHFYQWENIVIDQARVETARRCLYIDNPVSLITISNYYCKQIANNGSSAGVETNAIFGCKRCKFLNWTTDDGGFFHNGGGMIGFHDSTASQWQNLLMYFNTNGGTQYAFNALDSWGNIVDGFYIGPDINTSGNPSSNNFGFGQATYAMNWANSNGANDTGKNQIRNGTIYTPTSYTGTALQVNCSGAGANPCDSNEFSGVKIYALGGTCASVTSASAGTALDVSFVANEFHGCTTGISASGANTKVYARENIYGSVTTPWSAASSAKFQLDERYGILFAKLPTVANMISGSLVYVTDSNATCAAGASTGKFCAVTNGAYVAGF